MMLLKVEFHLHLSSFLAVNVHNGAYPTHFLTSLSGYSVGKNHLINFDDLSRIIPSVYRRPLSSLNNFEIISDIYNQDSANLY